MNEALRIADRLDREDCNMSFQDIFAAAAQLRSLVAQRDDLMAALKDLTDYVENTAFCEADYSAVSDARTAIRLVEEWK